ncbi:NAD(P)H-dependent oxidoreductase [Bombilactobacillus bombi]|uniref:NAD(P)H-dependent oxidoreductase n=1 Tax=Bombilactobacillus bombi TaxID=1303590 RepID=UPI0015E5D1DC|nr:NAD(P)H-dependent oxidoreductase [Bombilactobacillus bombi]MBA1434014.1 FAD-dependent oxidoreductase [Bombilactobacillus bombi]
MKLIGIVGTNAHKSYNRMLLQYIKKHFSNQFDLEVCDIRDIPLFNENHPAADPKSVTALAEKIEAADGVIISTPEHNHSVPSPLKSVIEWLSYRIHPLTNKSLMIVGASYHPQGSSRAQVHLRQILDSPGVNPHVLPGNEFLLGNAKTAFDAEGNIANEKTVSFLEQCITAFINFVNANQLIDEKLSSSKATTDLAKTISEVDASKLSEKSSTINWDASYDVVVLGFGGAGATAARFAADEGAHVLLVDAAPEGYEGGNTRVSHQLIASGDNFDNLKAYYKQMAAPIGIDDEVLSTFVEGLVQMNDYVKKYLNVEPFSIRKQWSQSDLSAVTEEYPEFEGVQSADMTTVHEGIADAALWKILRQKVIDRADKIDVWFSSPARHLLQDPVTKAVIGVQTEHEHVVRNIQAQNGVVLATGGFENNQQMIEDYLQEPYLSPIGTTYNKGAGVKMALEVGADLWHMRSYESLGQLHGLSPQQPQGVRSQYATNIFWPALFTGSILAVGDDATRYFKEDEINRHGHIYNHGFWRVPLSQVHPAVIFDQKQFDKIQADKDNPAGYPDILKFAVQADTIAQLAAKISTNPDNLQQTINDFNHFAQAGTDYAYHRSPETMTPFSEQGPYYAILMRQNMLNTQGGARRNSHCQVLNPEGQPIAHLYEAGELGAPFANQYAGGGNLADCLISGKIAGQNAAQVKSDLQSAGVMQQAATDTVKNLGSDLQKEEAYSTTDNQYLGTSNAGMGDEIVVRVTLDEQQNLEQVEVLKQSESEDVSKEALKTLPQEMVTKNTYDVDAVSGATRTSTALKEAVKDALSKAK